jgi:TetR/AcrR family transcriptional regulator, cholesterol catabolism regulator
MDGNFGDKKSFRSFVFPKCKMDVKERILIKADDLFMRYGIRSVSMDDIALELGMSKKTLYQYYVDKDELVDAVMNATIIKNEHDCDIDRETSENAIDEIFKAMEMVEEMFRNMNPSILYDIEKYHPKTFARFQKHKNEYIYMVIRENLVRGIKEELYRPEINLDILSKFRLESMMLPFSPEFHGRNKFNLADLEQEIMEHYLYGLASLKGHKLILKYKQERIKKTVSNAKIK